VKTEQGHYKSTKRPQTSSYS